MKKYIALSIILSCYATNLFSMQNKNKNQKKYRPRSPKNSKTTTSANIHLANTTNNYRQINTPKEAFAVPMFKAMLIAQHNELFKPNGSELIFKEKIVRNHICESIFVNTAFDQPTLPNLWKTNDENINSKK